MYIHSGDANLFAFDLDAMLALASKNRKQYAANQPFPHIVIDNFLPKAVASKFLEHFPQVDSPVFVNRNSAHQPGKYGTVRGENIARVSHFIQHVLAMMQSYSMIHFLTALTGIEKLLPDPHFTGGGLHQIVNGGKLDVHADFNFEPGIGLYRRINLLLYFNKEWQDSYGGNLEIWDRELKTRVHSIAPLFNRCVIFNTSQYSYHGHPVPLNVPYNGTRKSLALYYYTKDPIPGDEQPHSTLWQKIS